ncbi:uncharacterized protein LOC125058710 isoform X2 [Pieris napi]|nr:uncharacterized protein LOC125058710 isoform X2 [Pieris napi]
MKYWSDKKSAVKKKAAIRTGQRRQTGGGIAEIVHLTEWEERIISLMGGDRFYDGDPSLRVHPFSGPTSSSSGSIRIFTPPHSIAPVTLIGPTSSSSGSIRIFTPPHSIAPVTLIGPTSSSSGSIRIFTPPHSIAPVTLIEPSTISNINLDIQENPTIAENINL